MNGFDYLLLRVDTVYYSSFASPFPPFPRFATAFDDLASALSRAPCVFFCALKSSQLGRLVSAARTPPASRDIRVHTMVMTLKGMEKSRAVRVW